MKIIDLSITIIGLIILLVFGFRTLTDFGVGLKLKSPFSFLDFFKKSNNIESLKSTAKSLPNSVEVKKLNPVLIKLTYYPPTLMPEDECGDGMCKGEYVLIGENSDTIRIDPLIKCTEFKPESYHYDSGPYDPKTGTYMKIITDWQGTEIRKCSWFDVPKSRIISRENLLYATSTKKQILNYDTIDEFGSKVVK